MGFRVQGVRFRVWAVGVGCRVRGSKYKVVQHHDHRRRPHMSVVIATSFRDIAESGVMSTLPTHNIRLDMLIYGTKPSLKVAKTTKHCFMFLD